MSPLFTSPHIQLFISWLVFSTDAVYCILHSMLHPTCKYSLNPCNIQHIYSYPIVVYSQITMLCVWESICNRHTLNRSLADTHYTNGRHRWIWQRYSIFSNICNSFAAASPFLRSYRGWKRFLQNYTGILLSPPPLYSDRLKWISPKRRPRFPCESSTREMPPKPPTQKPKWNRWSLPDPPAYTNIHTAHPLFAGKWLCVVQLHCLSYYQGLHD